MGNAVCKIQVCFNVLEVFIKKIKISLFKEKKEKEEFKNIELSKIDIDEYEFKQNYRLFELAKEPEWEFCLKNWT